MKNMKNMKKMKIVLLSVPGTLLFAFKISLPCGYSENEGRFVWCAAEYYLAVLNLARYECIRDCT